MNRRSFLKFLIAAPVAAEFDIEKLLWIPGQKTIFLPPKIIISEAEIISLEIDRLLPMLKTLFDRDEYFYTKLIK